MWVIGWGDYTRAQKYHVHIWRIIISPGCCICNLFNRLVIIHLRGRKNREWAEIIWLSQKRQVDVGSCEVSTCWSPCFSLSGIASRLMLPASRDAAGISIPSSEISAWYRNSVTRLGPLIPVPDCAVGCRNSLMPMPRNRNAEKKLVRHRYQG